MHVTRLIIINPITTTKNVALLLEVAYQPHPRTGTYLDLDCVYGLLASQCESCTLSESRQ